MRKTMKAKGTTRDKYDTEEKRKKLTHLLIDREKLYKKGNGEDVEEENKGGKYMEERRKAIQTRSFKKKR